MNTVAASFNTAVRQMTKMPLSKKMTEMSQRRTTARTYQVTKIRVQSQRFSARKKAASPSLCVRLASSLNQSYAGKQLSLTDTAGYEDGFRARLFAELR